MGVRKSFRKLALSADPALRRFFVPISLSLALTITLIIAVDGAYALTNDVNRLSMGFFLGILVSASAILFLEFNSGGLKSSWSNNLLSAIPAALTVFATYLLMADSSPVSAARYMAAALSMTLLFLAVPGFFRNKDGEMYLVNLFLQGVTAVLFSMVLYLGFSAIIFTVTNLFSITIRSTVYLKLWISMATFVAPFILMAGIPKQDQVHSRRDYPRILENLLVYAVTPLLTAYTAVLYAYFVKILVTRVWPQGLVSHLVLWYALFGVVLSFFIRPLEDGSQWIQIFSRYFSKAVLPLLLMMFAGMAIRIKAYGITENRYYVLSAGLWVFGVMLYTSFKKDRKTFLIPFSLAVIVLLSVVGPWSSFPLSVRSQNQRLASLLTENNMLEGGIVRPSGNIVTAEDKEEIASIVLYFNRNHSLKDIPVLPDSFKIDDFDSVFGFSRYSYAGAGKPIWYTAEALTLDIGSFEYFFDFTNARVKNGFITLEQGNLRALYEPETQILRIYNEDSQEWEKDLSLYVDAIVEKYGGEGIIEPPLEELIFQEQTRNLNLLIAITNFGVEINRETLEATHYQLGFMLLSGEQ